MCCHGVCKYRSVVHRVPLALQTSHPGRKNEKKSVQLQARDRGSANAEEGIYYGAKCCVSVCFGSLVSCVTALSSPHPPPPQSNHQRGKFLVVHKQKLGGNQPLKLCVFQPYEPHASDSSPQGGLLVCSFQGLRFTSPTHQNGFIFFFFFFFS